MTNYYDNQQKYKMGISKPNDTNLLNKTNHSKNKEKKQELRAPQKTTPDKVV